jgi:hypothetical protein
MFAAMTWHLTAMELMHKMGSMPGMTPGSVPGVTPHVHLSGSGTPVYRL